MDWLLLCILKDLPTLIIAIFALIISFITFYFQFFHKPNSLLVVIDPTHPDMFSIDQNKGLKILLTLIFINSGKRSNALIDVSIFLAREKSMQQTYDIYNISFSETKFVMEPGMVKLVKVEGFEEFYQFQFISNKDIQPPKAYLGLSFDIVTDKGEKVFPK